LKYSIVDISYSQNGIDTGQNGPPQDSNERFPTGTCTFLSKNVDSFSIYPYNNEERISIYQ
ncbi:hypothetical protein ABWK46_23285, partial [Peribacillus frigoritolerans]|uniref:hypothetical protein n=1 Tax=Peribacillus frigoritolerans TaxID=450367 RepID=UPI00339ADD13